MYPDFALQQRQVIGNIKYLPAVSIILPFNPVITRKADLEYNLMLIMHKIEQELLTLYTAEKVVPVLIKLKNVIRNISYSTHKKSIAIFVSPVIDKVYYLDIEVKRKIVIDDSFEMRNIILNKKQTLQYLVMYLSNKNSEMYIGNCSGFRLIKSNIWGNTRSKDFIQDMDHGLSFILKAYPLPLFLIATEKAMGRFRNITQNEEEILQHIEVGDETIQAAGLHSILIPYEANWKNIKQVYLLNQIKKAGKKGKLTFGISNVWNKAMQNKGKRLIIETKYITPQLQLKTDSVVNRDYLTGNPFYIKDEVDEIIEKVLENDGDVEFIDKGLLNDYKQIALIEK